MKIISKPYQLSLAFSLVLPLTIFAFLSSAYAFLVDTSQNQAFESRPQAAANSKRPVSFPAFKLASVNFITGGGNLVFSAPDFTDKSVETCKSLGFNKTSCASGVPGNTCPYNSSYFSQCCDERYKYSKSQCVYPNTISGDSCGGKYMCYCDRSLYKVTASSCKAPLVPASGSGNSCVEDGVIYYSSCVCPATYTQVCNGNNMEGTGQGCTIGGITKYISCQCKAGYNLTCANSTPENASDYCLKDGIKYYSRCKTCPNACTLNSCPAGVSCSKEECSGKYCANSCSTGYVDLENYWCNGALKCLLR